MRSGSDKPNFADLPSPYEALKRELKGNKAADDEDESHMPTTPGQSATHRLPDMSMTPLSSPFAPTSHLPSAQRNGVDPLLHRVLDKNYRLQATPHSTRNLTRNKTPVNKPSWRDSDSPMSSPPVAAPQLHADIFSSPIRQQYNRPTGPRTPGVSVQTPAKGKSREVPAMESKVKDEITWESDSDEDADGIYKELGMSPPKTIQFSLPQSRLLQTPGMHIGIIRFEERSLTVITAREASKRIVEDLLMTAGAGHDSDDLDSPSMIKMQNDLLDESF
jgi:DASH complex subunit ASK1